MRLYNQLSVLVCSSKSRYLNILGGRFAWNGTQLYPLAHVAAVTMSCFFAELQAPQLLFPTSASGIVRALPSFLLYTLKFPDSRCWPLVSLSDNLNPFQWCRGGKHKLCTYGAGMAKSSWAGTPSYAKTTDLSGSIFSSPVPESHRKTDTVFITPAAAEENIW